jgi:hypothetical protein
MPLNGTPSFSASPMPAKWGRLSSRDPEAEIGSSPTPLHQPFQTLIATYEQALRAMGRAGSAVRDHAVGRNLPGVPDTSRGARLCGYFHARRDHRFHHDSSEFSRSAHQMPAEVISSSRGRSALTAFRIRLVGWRSGCQPRFVCAGTFPRLLVDGFGQRHPGSLSFPSPVCERWVQAAYTERIQAKGQPARSIRPRPNTPT